MTNSFLPGRLAVSAVFFVNGFLYANWAARIPQVQHQIHADNGSLGLVLLFAGIGAVLAMPFTGYLIKQSSSAVITTIAAISLCFMMPLLSLADTVWVEGAAFFFVGISTGIMDVAMNAQAVQVEQHYKKPIMSSFHAVFSGGMIIGSLAGAVFLRSGVGLQLHFLVVGITGLLVILISMRFLIYKKAISIHKTAAKERPAILSGAVIVLGLIALCSMLGEGSMTDWTTKYMIDITKASIYFAPLGLSCFAAAMTVGRVFGDFVRSRINDKKLLLASSATAFVGMILIVSYPSVVLTLAGIFLVGIGLSVIVPICYSVAGNLHGLEPGAGISRVSTIGYSGFLCGPPLIGFISRTYSLRLAFCFVLALFAALIYLSLQVSENQTSQSQS